MVILQGNVRMARVQGTIVIMNATAGGITRIVIELVLVGAMVMAVVMVIVKIPMAAPAAATQEE